MKKLLLLFFLVFSSMSIQAQNIFKKLHDRNLEHTQKAQEYEQQNKLSEDLALQSKNAGTELRKAGELMMTGIIVQTIGLGVGTIVQSNDTKKTNNGYYVMGAGAIIGLGFQIAGLSKIIKAGKVFEIKLSVQ